jgi:long-chain acyl-CoA synthetase
MTPPPPTITRFSDVPELLAGLRRLPPERPALTFYKGRARQGSLSYGDLLVAVDRMTRRLREEIGIQRGDRIAILAANRVEVPTLLLATMRIGAAVVPLNPTTGPADWDYALAHSEARAIFGAKEMLARVNRLPPGVFAFEDEPAAAPDPAAVDAARLTDEPAAPGTSLSRTMAVVLYTSGTTGNPKGVSLAQESLLANAWSMAVNFRLDGQTQFAVLPLYHAHALGFGLMTALTTGGHLVFTDRFDPFAWAEIVRAEKVLVTSVVPTLLTPLLQVGVRRDKVPTLRAILVSSAPLTAEAARTFESKAEIPLIQGWGLSEYTNFACCLSPDLPDADRRRLLYGGELTSIGGPLSGVEVKVAGPAGDALPEDQRGELCIRGPSTMLQYFRDAAATAAMLGDDGWLRTGDEGFFHLDGGIPNFFITGRIKEIIIRDGDKWSPLAIERELLAGVPEIEGRFVVLGFPHQGHGEEIGVYLEAEAVDDGLRGRLEKAVAAMPLEMRPKVVLYGAAPIPRTHTGKIQRRKLHPTFASYRDCRGALRIERAPES